MFLGHCVNGMHCMGNCVMVSALHHAFSQDMKHKYPKCAIMTHCNLGWKFLHGKFLFPQKLLQELSNMPLEVLSHPMASLHSKDNTQGSPALLLIQLLFTPHLLSNIWQIERFVKEFRLPPNQFDNNRISVVFNIPAFLFPKLPSVAYSYSNNLSYATTWHIDVLKIA